jgi:hypothetical protein
MSEALRRKIAVRRPEGGWSTHVSTATTQRLHERFVRLAAQSTFDLAALTLMVRKANGSMAQNLPLIDEYQPFAQADFGAGDGFGTIRVVYPFCADADRSVSVHTVGRVPDAIVDRVIERVMETLPIPPTKEQFDLGELGGGWMFSLF